MKDKYTKRNIPIASADSIPTIEFFEKAFKEFKNCKETDYNLIMKEYVRIFNSYPIVPMRYTEKGNFDNMKFYRVITEKERIENNLPLNKLTSFSHPPFGSCGKQRFNIPGYPDLYLSGSQHTAIEEKRRQFALDSTMYLSEWEFKKGINMTYLLLLEPKYFTGELSDTIIKITEEKLDEIFRIYPPDKIKALKYYISCLTELCLAVPFNDLTSAIGHYYLHQSANKFDPPIGYLAYPSIAKKTDSINYAVNPLFFTKGLIKCTGITKITLSNHRVEGSDFKLDEVGVVENNEVIWKKYAYRIESASFFDNNNYEFLNFRIEDF